MTKRILAFLLAVMFILAVVPTGAFAKTNGIKYGDVNGDGEVDLNDALILKRYIAEQNPYGFNTVNSDVNMDNETDMSDLLMLKKYLAEWNVRLGPEILTVRFYDGDTLIDTLVAYNGYPLSELPSSLKTSKANAVFEGWYTDRACTVPFYADAPVTENMSVWAKYDELEGTSLTVTSFAQTDIGSDAEFQIAGEGDITAVTLVSKDGSDPVALSISGNGLYTVKAKDGFKKGASYELTLPEGLNFIGSDGNEMPDTVRTAYFTVAKEAVNNIKISEGVHYVKNTDPSNLKDGDKITLDGVAAGEVICFYKTVNPKDRDYKTGNAYTDDPETWFKAGEVSDGLVTLKKLEESDSEKIYDVPDNFPVIGALPQENGGTLTLAEDGDGYTLDVNLYAYMTEEKDDATVEYANSRVSVGDFVSIYVSSSEIDAEEDIYFGKITSYDETSGIITYVKSSAEEIEESMDLYIQPVLKGEDLLSESARQEIERKVLSQVSESGFATQAGFVLAELAANTDSFRNMEGVQVLFSDENGNELSDDEIELLNIGKSFELKDGVDLKVEIVTSGEQLHYQDKGSVQLNVGIDADFEVETDDGGKVIIDLSASFTQELAIGITASGELVKKEILFIPVPVGVKIGSAVDLLSYTGVSMSVHAYTVAEEDEPIWEQLKSVAENPEQLADVLPNSDRFAEVKKGLETVGDVFDKIDELGEKIEQVRDNAEKTIEYTEDLATLWEMVGEMEIDGLPDEEQWKEMGEALGKTNISEDLADMLDISSETELNAGEWERGLEGLLAQYGEMLENETDWVKLVQEEMCRAEVNICGLVIYVKADFVVRADMNIVMGADLSYQVGRRYNFWIKVGLFKPSAGSSTMDLTDEEFALRFYVMGKLGIKMGVEATAGFAIGSADVARVGVRLEIGPYVKIYGFFIYEYERSREANTSEWNSEESMAGALYLDFGLYLVLGVDASALGDLFEVSYDFVDKEFPLLEAGNKKYPYAFLCEFEDDEKIVIRDEDGDSTNGITASLPEECITLKCCNLDSGILGTVVYGIDSYNFTFSNPKFKMDGDGVITVDVPDGVRYLECEMRVTYKYGKLAFSKYDMQLIVPLVWTNLSSDEIGEYYTASVRVGNETDGYETVWSKRVVKNQEFTLPTEEEIKEIIGYDSAKYSNFECFGTAGTTTSIIENTSFDCNVEYTPYSVTVDNIYNADGTCESRTFTTRYGEAFDFTSLLDTGINISNDDPTVAKFTKFSKVVTNSTVTVGTDKDGNAITEVIDLTQPVTKKTAAAIADGNVRATAEYTDDSVLVTYTFTGAQIPEYSERIRKGTLSSYDFNKTVAWYGMMVKNISPDISPVYSAVTYNVECSDIVGEKYTISFNENGGSRVSETERIVGSLIGTLPTSEREGYTFKGWYSDEMLTVKFNERLMPEEDVHLWAKWEANTYKITFNVNGGDAWTDEDNGTKTVTYDGIYQDLPLPSRSGYGFIGYFTAREGGTQVTCDTKVTVTQDTTLYARWKLLKTIPKSVFDFGDAEKATYSKGVSHEVLYSFAAEEGESYGLSDFTLKYMRQGNSEYEEGLPVNAGTYDVVVSRPADNDYAKFEQIYTAVITVDKATRSPEAFANADLLTSSLKSGLNYIEMRLDPDSIDDFDAENTKVVFTASNIQGNIVILSEGGKSQATSANKNARIINLLPDTEYALTFTVTGDPNYYDYTHTKYLSATVRTIKNDTSEFWTDHAEAFTVNEGNKTVTIENEAQLAYLAKTVNASGGAVTYEGYTFTLSRDMYLLDYAWKPIGADGYFAGIFDGNGHTVYGVHTSEDEYASGLFGFVYYGEIKNLTVAESYICGSVKVGAVVGWIRGNVTNCVNYSTVVGRCSYNQSGGGTGGIAGESEGYSALKISGCVNNGRVDGVCQTGGIVGALDSNIATNNLNNGTVKGTNNHTGGIAGIVNNANVMNSVNTGSVTGVNCVAGIVGQNQEKGYVLNCYTTGTVNGTGVYVGAVVGRNYKKCTVHQCYYLYNSASCNGSYRNAVGTEKDSMEDGKDGTSTAYFTSATSSLSRNADCGNTNLLSALNNWVEWWNDYNCNAVWTAGEDGYPLPNGNINTQTGTKQ